VSTYRRCSLPPSVNAEQVIADFGGKTQHQHAAIRIAAQQSRPLEVIENLRIIDIAKDVRPDHVARRALHSVPIPLTHLPKILRQANIEPSCESAPARHRTRYPTATVGDGDTLSPDVSSIASIALRLRQFPCASRALSSWGHDSSVPGSLLSEHLPDNITDPLYPPFVIKNRRACAARVDLKHSVRATHTGGYYDGNSCHIRRRPFGRRNARNRWLIAPR